MKTEQQIRELIAQLVADKAKKWDQYENSMGCDKKAHGGALYHISGELVSLRWVLKNATD